MNDINEQPSTQTVRINLTQLTVSPEFQVRHKLDKHQTKRYENVLKSGGELPPVKVALVDGVYILVDGWHRVRARENLGEGSIDAEVVQATYSDALWMAASANLEHGLPLKSSELRKVFKVFIRAKKHRKSRGKLMTYREIGQEIGKPHTTIRNWMSKDFPKLFNQYSGAEDFMFTKNGGLSERDPLPPNVREGLESIHAFRELYRLVSCPLDKRRLAEAFTSTAQEMLGDGWTEVRGDF